MKEVIEMYGEIIPVTTSTYMANRLLQAFKEIDYNKKLEDEEVIGHLIRVTDDEIYARWLSKGVKDVRGLAKILNEILEGIY